ncbi:tRNA (guanine-N1)-methyltransferase [Thiovulum sp. ES]|nr:tRNA (guanine-N1)-methyltransferase [Thiovulum sp. ES]
MKFNFITLFPELLQSYFSASILGKAVENGKIEIEFLNPRDFTTDRHNRVDLSQIGGGAGMLMMTEPIEKAIASIPNRGKVIALSPVGKPFKQNDAKRLAKEENITFLSGRYEGFDERVIENCDEVFSVGDFILTGGELPSLILCDAISRNVSGVLGNGESLNGESFENELLESPNFTKPVSGVPSEYLNGNHAKIESLRFEMSKRKTQFFRPDLYNKIIRK